MQECLFLRETAVVGFDSLRIVARCRRSAGTLVDAQLAHVNLKLMVCRAQRCMVSLDLERIRIARLGGRRQRRDHENGQDVVQLHRNSPCGFGRCRNAQLGASIHRKLDLGGDSAARRASVRDRAADLGENNGFPAVDGLLVLRRFVRCALLALSGFALASCSALPPTTGPGATVIRYTASGAAYRSFALPLWQVRSAAVNALSRRGFGIAALGSTEHASTVLGRGATGNVTITLDRKAEFVTTVTVDTGGNATLATAILRDIAAALLEPMPPTARS